MKYFFITILCFVALFFAFNVGLKRTETAECLKWKRWRADYPLFTPADWQRKQCEARQTPIE
jgi:hypothetical protein